MKNEEGELVFKLTLGADVILYAFEEFEIKHGLAYSTDASC